jgi:hypothetical protein
MDHVALRVGDLEDAIVVGEGDVDASQIGGAVRVVDDLEVRVSPKPALRVGVGGLELRVRG